MFGLPPKQDALCSRCKDELPDLEFELLNVSLDIVKLKVSTHTQSESLEQAPQVMMPP